jgi:hypothetical protein
MSAAEVSQARTELVDEELASEATNPEMSSARVKNKRKSFRFSDANIKVSPLFVSVRPTGLRVLPADVKGTRASYYRALGRSSVKRSLARICLHPGWHAKVGF